MGSENQVEPELKLTQLGKKEKYSKPPSLNLTEFQDSKFIDFDLSFISAITSPNKWGLEFKDSMFNFTQNFLFFFSFFFFLTGYACDKLNLFHSALFNKILHTFHLIFPRSF